MVETFRMANSPAKFGGGPAAVMRYAAAYKPGSEPLYKFIKRKGGINACAARFSRWVGR